MQAQEKETQNASIEMTKGKRVTPRGLEWRKRNKKFTGFYERSKKLPRNVKRKKNKKRIYGCATAACQTRKIKPVLDAIAQCSTL